MFHQHQYISDMALHKAKRKRGVAVLKLHILRRVSMQAKIFRVGHALVLGPRGEAGGAPSKNSVWGVAQVGAQLVTFSGRVGGTLRFKTRHSSMLDHMLQLFKDKVEGKNMTYNYKDVTDSYAKVYENLDKALVEDFKAAKTNGLLNTRDGAVKAVDLLKKAEKPAKAEKAEKAKPAAKTAEKPAKAEKAPVAAKAKAEAKATAKPKAKTTAKPKAAPKVAAEEKQATANAETAHAETGDAATTDTPVDTAVETVVTE